MAQIINLRTRRKQAARKAGQVAGTQNAAQSGLSKADKSLSAARSAKAARDLDGKRRDPPIEPAPTPPDINT